MIQLSSAAGPCSQGGLAPICLFGPLSARQRIQMQHAYSIGWVSLSTVTPTPAPRVISFGEDVEETDYISRHSYLFSTAQSAALGPSREMPSIIPVLVKTCRPELELWVTGCSGCTCYLPFAAAYFIESCSHCWSCSQIMRPTFIAQ